MNSRQCPSKPVAPHRDQPGGGAGLLIIDMINAFDFSGGKSLRSAADEASKRIIALRKRADAKSIPVIYVNDNFGEWHSDRSQLIDMVGDRVTDLDILPRQHDYFVLKPQFSGFYATNLQVLLPKLGITRLILTGVATDICVLFTAADAYMRDYALWVPRDAVAADDFSRHEAALEIIGNRLRADIRATSDPGLSGWNEDPKAKWLSTSELSAI
ncbi:putative isochorismatase family protein YaaI [Novosphingobium marinum]|nr:isochorismatase family cysteine hydrolase [Novosphingobium marinum]GGC44411.1 putative isochorismatase family protein YaaI [Novosphingobium marinum]